MRLALALFLAFSATLAHASSVERTTARTSDGRDIDVQINVASYRLSQVPAVVIAPGAGYHMDLPLLRELAEKFASEGFIAYRFNWDYFTKDPQNGEPSLPTPDHPKEVLDMQAVVELAKKDGRVDASRIFVIGKSLGSRVAYRVFQQDSSLRAVVLATPICTEMDASGRPMNAGDKNYPSLSSLGRPLMMASSDADPHCQTEMLKAFVAPMPAIWLSIVGGDHGWNVCRGQGQVCEISNRANRQAGVGNIFTWIKGQLARF